MKYIIPFICLFASITTVSGQDLREDQTFFNKKANSFQAWMDLQGIGKYLKVRELDIKEDQLALYLEFPYQDLDSIISAWDLIKTRTESQSQLSLEEQLFYKFTLFMELRQTRGNIQIYDTYDLREEPLFFRGIYFDSDSGKVLVQSNDPKSQIVYIDLPGNDVEGANGTRTIVDQPASKAALFDKILAFAENEYEDNNSCSNRDPHVQTLENENHLHFRVKDLCRVILDDYNSSGPVCQLMDFFGFDCDNTTREMLDILISYDQRTGYSGGTLEINITGKFGSGYYSQVARGAYQDMEGDPRFLSYIEDYARTFKLRLQKYLQQH